MMVYLRRISSVWKKDIRDGFSKMTNIQKENLDKRKTDSFFSLPVKKQVEILKNQQNLLHFR